MTLHPIFRPSLCDLCVLCGKRSVDEKRAGFASVTQLVQAIGTSALSRVGLSTALVRNWSSLFLNRMLNVVSDS